LAGLLTVAGLTACGDKVNSPPVTSTTTTAVTPVVHGVSVTSTWFARLLRFAGVDEQIVPVPTPV
jgi:hypothetical protein